MLVADVGDVDPHRGLDTCDVVEACPPYSGTSESTNDDPAPSSTSLRSEVGADEPEATGDQHPAPVVGLVEINLGHRHAR